jgi:hypothetical protein
MVMTFRPFSRRGTGYERPEGPRGGVLPQRVASVSGCFRASDAARFAADLSLPASGLLQPAK